ncbi:hypothetical protein SITYG_10970 [Streptococcus intermedius]|uniref:Uncharacterized protein n=1 Tax=Streptococcus intermedius TaxID=1338 RepID=A0AAD1FIL7_STRIT|nr:hypothetical protein SITYG_00810 [Streptococcus intermedius]BAW17076.1 hypothetical protein SITYG_10970 [Streptococcus intermedius]
MFFLSFFIISLKDNDFFVFNGTFQKKKTDTPKKEYLFSNFYAFVGE